MKKSNYIQPTIELVRLQQFTTLCQSLPVGDPLDGGGLGEPVIIT